MFDAQNRAVPTATIGMARNVPASIGLGEHVTALPSPAEKLVAASRRIGRGVGGEGTHNGRSEVKPLYLTTSILSVAWKLLASNR